MIVVLGLDNYLLLFLLVHLLLPEPFRSRRRRTRYFLVLSGLIGQLRVQQVLEYRAGSRTRRFICTIGGCRCIIICGCLLLLWLRLAVVLFIRIRFGGLLLSIRRRQNTTGGSRGGGVFGTIC